MLLIAWEENKLPHVTENIILRASERYLDIIAQRLLVRTNRCGIDGIICCWGERERARCGGTVNVEFHPPSRPQAHAYQWNWSVERLSIHLHLGFSLPGILTWLAGETRSLKPLVPWQNSTTTVSQIEMGALPGTSRQPSSNLRKHGAACGFYIMGDR